MIAGALLRAEMALGWRWSRETAAILLLGLGFLALLFHAEIAAAVTVSLGSTAYNHCFLVLPIATYLAWERRALLAGMQVWPAPWAALAAIPLAAMWFAAERLGIMEGRQLAALGILELLFLAVLGWRLWRALAAPLLYLVFLVPFGGFLVPSLQDFTWRFAVAGLDLLGIPNFADDQMIQIPEGTFYVAEACAGLRFLIASVAFGALYACLMYRSPWRRLLFMAASIFMPVIANGFRALGIIWLGHELGSAQAAAADHVLYGWLFFSIIILALAAGGAPFRQAQVRGNEPGPAHKPPSTFPWPGARCLAAAASVLALAALGPVASAGLDRAAAATPAVIPPDVLAGFSCTPVPETSETSFIAARTLVCTAPPLTLRVEVFPARATLRPVLESERRLISGFAGDESRPAQIAVPGAVPQVWHLIEAQRGGAAATALWLGGGAESGGLRSRLRQAWISLASPSYAPVLVAIIGEQPNAATLIRAFLTDHPELSARMARLSATAARPLG